MVLATSNDQKQLLFLTYIGRLSPEEVERSVDTIRPLLPGLKPDFTVLVDFTHLEYMGHDCAAPIGRLMESSAKAGVGTVIRVIPDPYKDIGMNILSCFHFSHRPRIVTCASMMEAAEVLAR
jgi:hypothetical protein